MTLAAATEAYQALLEGHRRLDPADDLELWEQVAEDVEKARREVEVAWLEQKAGLA